MTYCVRTFHYKDTGLVCKDQDLYIDSQNNVCQLYYDQYCQSTYMILRDDLFHDEEWLDQPEN